MESDGKVEHRGDTGGDYEGEDQACDVGAGHAAYPPCHEPAERPAHQVHYRHQNQLQATGLRGGGSRSLPRREGWDGSRILDDQRLQYLAEPELDRPVGERRHEKAKNHVERSHNPRDSNLSGWPCPASSLSYCERAAVFAWVAAAGPGRYPGCG